MRLTVSCSTIIFVETLSRLFDLFPVFFIVVWIASVIVTILVARRKAAGTRNLSHKLPTGLRAPHPDTTTLPHLAAGESVAAEYGNIQTSFLGLAPAFCSVFLIQTQAGKDLAFVFAPVQSDSGPSQYRLGYAGCKHLQNILGTDERAFRAQSHLLGYVNPAGASVSKGIKWAMRTLFRFAILADFGVIEDTSAQLPALPGQARKQSRTAAAMIWKRNEDMFLVLVFRSRGTSPSLGIHLFAESGRGALRTVLHHALGAG